MKRKNDYWFFIEPYVYPHFANDQVLLYNTLDGTIIETENHEIKVLLQELLKTENGGVAFLSAEQYAQKDISEFIQNVREKFMGDIININLSLAKPIQILPYVDFLNRRNLKGSFLKVDNILQLLLKITINIDRNTNIVGMYSFLKSLPKNPSLNLKINREIDSNLEEMLLYLNQVESEKIVICEYDNLFILNSHFRNKFSYRISVHFPIEESLWRHSVEILKRINLSYTVVFYVKSIEDVDQSELLIKQYQVEKFHLQPVYTKENITFFMENVFLTREDILSTPMDLKGFFKKQVLNKNDFGKITIMSNGDVYANTHHPTLGNIYTHSIYWLIQKEINDGYSWLRTRNQEPCNKCIYQWLCPSPSNFELEIGRPNLCNVK